MRIVEEKLCVCDEIITFVIQDLIHGFSFSDRFSNTPLFTYFKVFHKIQQRQYVAKLLRKDDTMNMMKPIRRVGYAYVPEQRMEKVYPPSKAIKVGTIFPELNIPMDEYERGLFDGK